ncbi:sterol desaturase [Leptospira perolatii]|uniref:Sterol desaturase n=1 Tax=Leptospira perolatii TaxID=2023191 RepID=A0A2M9ZPZ2_9LEPT|nr:sterol desaturase family protein [Leptospira perolatii]PJZ68982.1 sterol desaturase [Leptospira perolatii]PJZ74150.1 sterol desaturase [Leptospira perolatii]
MEINLITIAIPFFFLLIALEIAFSKYHNKKLYRLNDSINDLSAGVSNQVFGILFKLFLLASYIWLYQNWRIFDLPAWPSEPVSWIPQTAVLGISPTVITWTVVLSTWLACFFLYDLAYYWNHRLSHEVNFLWAGHVVHHQSEEYNLTVALRQASFHQLFSWVFYLPLAILGFPPIVMVLNGQLNLIYQFWIHTKAVDKLPGWFESVFNTPSHHRVHHGINPKYIDRNHGGTFIIFDKWFGTFQPEEEEVVYGTVKPLRSFNPIWANFHYWWEMIELAWKTPKWKDKLKVFFAVPGWRPEELGGQFPIPEVHPNTFHKYDVEIPKGLTAYALSWFVLTVIGTFAMLVTIAKIPDLIKYVIIASSLLSLLTIGGILDRKRWSLYVEPLRLAAFSAMGFFLLSGPVYWFGISGICLLSLGWFLAYRDRFMEWKEIDPGKEILRRTA